VSGAQAPAPALPGRFHWIRPSSRLGTINGVLLGGIYTLVACGLTLIYGVLHIINFAHGSMLMLAMFGVYYLLTKLGVDPYLSPSWSWCRRCTCSVMCCTRA
jgi:branched-subunit amino acid ABC-type transport system permease component